jgi:hypothetical protein
MITHAEFRRAAWRHWGRHLARVFGVFALSTFVFAILWFLLELVEPGDDPVTRAEFAMAVAVTVGLVTAVVSARSVSRNTREDPSLVCPYCDRSLGYYYVMLVLSSGKCPHCGEGVLDD